MCIYIVWSVWQDELKVNSSKNNIKYIIIINISIIILTISAHACLPKPRPVVTFTA